MATRKAVVRKDASPRRPRGNRATMKILVANRGEIACRILKTVREMGIPSVAIHADVESEAPHLSLADEVVPIGAPGNYLDAGLIVDGSGELGIAGQNGAVGGLGDLADEPVDGLACLQESFAFVALTVISVTEDKI